jgi:hypothetical protein
MCFGGRKREQLPDPIDQFAIVVTVVVHIGLALSATCWGSFTLTFLFQVVGFFFPPLGRFASVRGLVTSRQTFVRCRQTVG